MKEKELKNIIDKIQKDLSSSRRALDVAAPIMNNVQTLVDDNQCLEKEVKTLKNAINTLKGETVQPKVRKQTAEKANHSSESDRKSREKKKNRKKGGSKKAHVIVDKTKNLNMDAKDLPSDAVLAGIETTIIQDIKIITDNIAFKRQKYFSKSENKYYLTPLPAGYDDGEYGPNIKAWANTFYSGAQMTMSNISWLFNTAGSIISKTTVYRMIADNNEGFHAEKDGIIKASLKATDYQHLDDTSGRERGKNCYVNVLTNDYASIFFTLKSKDRLSIIEMLSVGGLKFLINEDALYLMDAMHLPQKHIEFFKLQMSDKYKLRSDIDTLLKTLFPNPKKHQSYRKIILEALSIAAYRQSDYAIKHLIVDDAPQFKLITENLWLCWVHEGRHYKKINPMFVAHEKLLENFQTRFWDYYQKLKCYKEKPTKNQKKELEEEFDELFSQETGYETLDKRIKKTKAKKKSLLLVLTYPYIQIHNNPAELIARIQARIRDIHLHTMSSAGTETKDTLATITATAKKLSVNVFKYLLDRITKRYDMTSLAEIIKTRSTLDRESNPTQLAVN